MSDEERSKKMPMMTIEEALADLRSEIEFHREKLRQTGDDSYRDNIKEIRKEITIYEAMLSVELRMQDQLNVLMGSIALALIGVAFQQIAEHSVVCQKNELSPRVYVDQDHLRIHRADDEILIQVDMLSENEFRVWQQGDDKQAYTFYNREELLALRDALKLAFGDY